MLFRNFVYNIQVIVTINGNSSPEEIEAALRKLNNNDDMQSKKHFDAFKYCGVIKLKEDAMDIRKNFRVEWE